jgi:ubiquinone biosynthesis protein UbiJ
MLLETPFAAALNHVLRSEAWARERLAPFAGQTVEIRPAFLPALRFSISSEGLVDPAAPSQPSDLRIVIRSEAPAAALKGEEALLRAVDVTGDAKLAEAVMALVRHLRWDYEEDLSRVFGDVVAHRMGEGLRALAAWAPDTAQRFAESFAGYATDEAKLVLGRPELERFAAEVSELRDAVERLEARIKRRG